MEEKEVLIAYNQELGRIFKVGYGLPKNPHNYTWLCKNCKKQIYYNKYLNCFKHRGLKPDGFEPETVEHKTMKKQLYDILPKFNEFNKREQEFWIDYQVADLYFESQEGKNIAIECQNSPITSKKLIARTKKYTKKDIYVLWIFNGSGTVVSEKKLPQNMEKVRVLGVEKRVQRLYGGRVYYMNVEGDLPLEDPYALHYSPYFEHEQLETSIYGHDKYYKEFQSATIGYIPSYKIVCNEYNGYKLARFMDKNVSISCTDQLLICINEYCERKAREGNLNEGEEVKIPVEYLINLVKEEFGYYLPYLILKRSKRIKKIRFEKILDEEYQVKDMITVKI